jgi:hypothetical protein
VSRVTSFDSLAPLNAVAGTLLCLKRWVMAPP